MSFKTLVREFKDGIGSRSRKVRNVTPPPPPPESAAMTWRRRHQGRWAELPEELLRDIMERVEAAEDTWPARRDVVACASVCRSWRETTMEVVKTTEESARITFPISLKQPGPRDCPIQCFIKRERATGIFRLYLGLSPALQGENGKLLLAARKIRRATNTDYLISLVSDDFSSSSNTYIGKLKSNFLGTKFTIYDNQPPTNMEVLPKGRSFKRLHSRKVSPRVPSGSYNIATICYELNVLRTRGPRRVLCTMPSIPNSAVQEGGTAPTPTSFLHSLEDQFSGLSLSMRKDPKLEFSSTSLTEEIRSGQMLHEPLVLKNKAPRWHEQLQCWCLNFRGRVTVASVKNFQLVAAVDPSQPSSSADQDRVILQFGKIGKDIFTMDYQYPLSAFQAFAICLSSFDTKPACE